MTEQGSDDDAVRCGMGFGSFWYILSGWHICEDMLVGRLDSDTTFVARRTRRTGHDEQTYFPTSRRDSGVSSQRKFFKKSYQNLVIFQQSAGCYGSKVWGLIHSWHQSVKNWGDLSSSPRRCCASGTEQSMYIHKLCQNHGEQLATQKRETPIQTAPRILSSSSLSTSASYKLAIV